MKPQHPRPGAATAGGLVALAIWSTTVAIARGMSESLGTLTAATLATAGGGVVALVASHVRGHTAAQMLRLPRRYLLGCGALFVLYMACFYAAVGWAPSRPGVLVVGLANYLWPALTVLLSVPLLGRRARPTLALGAAAAVLGTSLAVLGGGGVAWAQVRAAGGAGLAAPVLLAAAAAVCWALYSNLARRWGRPEGGAVPLFLLAAGAALALLRLTRTETTVWQPKAVCELAVVVVAQSALAYALWDRGMRAGNHLLLSLASYFTPVAATAFAAVYLGVRPTSGLLLGCGLVTAGALICKWSVEDVGPAP